MQVTVGGGCFWCLEAAFQLINGVSRVVPGYAGGHIKNPSYENVCNGTTGHAEVVQITFNENIINLNHVLDIYWAIHDPTTLNRQGNDVGTQYRSIIFYQSTAQKQVIEASIKEAQKLWKKPIVTEVKPLEVFYEAEPEHHNYFIKHPDKAYCQVIINPKLQKLRQTFASQLK